MPRAQARQPFKTCAGMPAESTSLRAASGGASTLNAAPTPSQSTAFTIPPPRTSAPAHSEPNQELHGTSAFCDKMPQPQPTPMPRTHPQPSRVPVPGPASWAQRTGSWAPGRLQPQAPAGEWGMGTARGQHTCQAGMKSGRLGKGAKCAGWLVGTQARQEIKRHFNKCKQTNQNIY